VLRTVGSLRVALERLGHRSATSPPATDDEILNALHEYTRVHRRAPTVAIWRSERSRPSASVILRRHGSWNAALSASLANDQHDLATPQDQHRPPGRHDAAV
jgi:HNH endonuclease